MIKNEQTIKKETTDANRHGFFIYRGSLEESKRLIKNLSIEYYE